MIIGQLVARLSSVTMYETLMVISNQPKKTHIHMKTSNLVWSNDMGGDGKKF